MYINRHEVSGNAVADAETKTLPSGEMLVTFSLATNNRWKDESGQLRERPEYHDCVAWGKLAEIAQHIEKSDRVYVDGPVETKKWTGEDGVERRRREIRVSNLIIHHGGIKKRPGSSPAEEAA